MKNVFVKYFTKLDIYCIIIMVNDMKNLNRKGFTLVELLAVFVLLSIVMGIGSYVITGLIKNAKNKDYELLKNNIHDAVEQYDIECKYGDVFVNCNAEITLGDLAAGGYLKWNAKDNSGKKILVDPRNKNDISSCRISYLFDSDEKLIITSLGGNGTCPTYS